MAVDRTGQLTVVCVRRRMSCGSSKLPKGVGVRARKMELHRLSLSGVVVKVASRAQVRISRDPDRIVVSRATSNDEASLLRIGADNVRHGMTRAASDHLGMTRAVNVHHGMKAADSGPLEMTSEGSGHPETMTGTSRVMVSSHRAVVSFVVPGEMLRHRIGWRHRMPSINEVDNTDRHRVIVRSALNASRWVK